MNKLVREYTNTNNRDTKSRLFTAICAKVEGIFQSLCMKNGVAYHGIDDARQEVMLKLLLVLPSYDEERASFTTFYYRVADCICQLKIPPITN